MYWSFSVYYEIKNPFYRQNEIFGKKIWSCPKATQNWRKKNWNFHCIFQRIFDYHTMVPIKTLHDFFESFFWKKGLQSKTKEKRCLNFLDISERKIDASSCFVEGGKFTIKFKKVKLLLSLIILLSLKFLPRVGKFVLFCHSIIVFIKPFLDRESRLLAFKVNNQFPQNLFKTFVKSMSFYDHFGFRPK